MSDILSEIERRREAGDGLCDSCDASGLYEGKVCMDCLGQKILLTADEYNTLLVIAARVDDAVLDRQEFDY